MAGAEAVEAICARLCLLTRAAWRDELPTPMTRPTVGKMLRLGALKGLTLQRIPEICEEHYARAEALLSRSAQMYQKVEAMYARGYRVLLPEDAWWPVNLHALGTQMPQFLFVHGNRAWLRRRTVAVAGSRRIEATTAMMARDCGKALAQEGYAMVSGGAEGVDTAAQCGFLQQQNGGLILVPARPVEELMRQDYLKAAMACGRLLLLCDTWPDEPFSPAKALGRNRVIYALGDAAIVVAARREQGGTWDGVSACLRGKHTPVYAVSADGADFEGNRLLLERGASPLDLQKPMGAQLFSTTENMERTICR